MIEIDQSCMICGLDLALFLRMQDLTCFYASAQLETGQLILAESKQVRVAALAEPVIFAYLAQEEPLA